MTEAYLSYKLTKWAFGSGELKSQKKWNVQGVPQSQATADSRHQEEEKKTKKITNARKMQMHEKLSLFNKPDYHNAKQNWKNVGAR